MIGLGTILNGAGIVLGGLVGLLFGQFIRERMRETLTMVCGLSVIFIGIAGAMEGMLRVENGAVASGEAMRIVLCLTLGAVIGELLNIEAAFERFGEWLKQKTGNAGDNQFVNAFVSASLTVCIGAMAIVGAIKDGLTGDWSLLATKAILDAIIIMALTCSLGKGCLFSALPVLVCEGTMTALAVLMKPLMNGAALANLSMIGSILIFCIGYNLIWDRKIRVANLLPAIILAVISAVWPG